MKLNVPGQYLQAVLDALPSMRAPTVSKLADQAYYAVETVVERNVVNVLIPKLKSIGPRTSWSWRSPRSSSRPAVRGRFRR